LQVFQTGKGALKSIDGLFILSGGLERQPQSVEDVWVVGGQLQRPIKISDCQIELLAGVVLPAALVKLFTRLGVFQQRAVDGLRFFLPCHFPKSP